MDRVRDAASAARTLREKVSVRVRQPLASMTIAGPGVARLAPYEALLRDEVNVKAVQLAESIDEWASFQLQVNSRAVGPRMGTAMKSVLAAAKEGRFEQLGDGRVRVADQILEAGEWQLRLDPKPGIVCEPLAAGDAIVVLDVALSDELIAEGVARDVVRAVQQARKDAGLHVSDRIRLALAVPDAWRGAVLQFSDWIAEQTLARSVEIVDAIDSRVLAPRIAARRRRGRDRRRALRGGTAMSDYFAPTMRLYVDRLVDWEGYLRLLHGSAPDVAAEVGAYRSVLETTASLAQSFERRAREHWDDEAELLPDGGAQPPAHIRDAYAQLREAGLVSLPVSDGYGGAALPGLLNAMYLEMISRADTSLMTVVGLQAGVAGDIEKYGSNELKAKWLPRFTVRRGAGRDGPDRAAGRLRSRRHRHARDRSTGRQRARRRREDLHHQRRRGSAPGAGARRRRPTSRARAPRTGSR